MRLKPALGAQPRGSLPAPADRAAANAPDPLPALSRKARPLRPTDRRTDRPTDPPPLPRRQRRPPPPARAERPAPPRPASRVTSAAADWPREADGRQVRAPRCRRARCRGASGPPPPTTTTLPLWEEGGGGGVQASRPWSRREPGPVPRSKSRLQCLASGEEGFDWFFFWTVTEIAKNSAVSGEERGPRPTDLERLS